VPLITVEAPNRVAVRKEGVLMRCIITLRMYAVLVVIILTTWALPAYAAPQDAGPVGWQTNTGGSSWMYCDNFYNGPPIATNPDGSPVTEYQKQHVYWCYPEQQEGFWIPTSASYFL
jgi:hypothetical protein